MNAKVKHLFEVLEQDKQQLLLAIARLNQGQLDYNPKPGKWSVSQIIGHLMTAESVAVNYMRKKSRGIDKLENSGLLESFKVELLKISQRIPLKYKAPKIVLENTRALFSMEELNTYWDNTRHDMEVFLNDIENKNIRKKIYKHPVVGYLDVLQALAFMRAHLRHHMPQVNRLVKIKNE